MMFLLHGIVREGSQPAECELPLNYVCAAGLAAATVQMPNQDSPQPDVAGVLRFQRIVQFLHDTTAVVPVRYGCWMADKLEIERHLAARRDEYTRMLEGLEGMSEMGVRLWLPERSEPAAPPPDTPGAQFLAQARRRLGCDSLAADEVGLADHLAASLEGLWSRRHSELACAQNIRLLSLYFLVPKQMVSQFKDRIASTPRPAEVRLLVTGPWPPYNFVGTWTSHQESALWRGHHSSTPALVDRAATC